MILHHVTICQEIICPPTGKPCPTATRFKREAASQFLCGLDRSRAHLRGCRLLSPAASVSVSAAETSSTTHENGDPI